MTNEIRLEWEFPQEDQDIRNCSAWIWQGEERRALYYFQTEIPKDWIYSIFSLNTHCFKVNLNLTHPAPRQFCRLEWKPNKRHGIFWFGDKPGVEYDDMLRKSTPESKSRRFIASDGAEYKWRQAGPDDRDLECYPPTTLFIKRGPIATWAANSKSLTITSGGQAIMDELVCMLLIHLWRLKWGHPF